MADRIEYKDSVVFHPGYYIKEIIDDCGLTQEDFAKRLDTTPKNLSVLVRGEQRLSVEMAMKLSRMLGASMHMWLNLQNEYDMAEARIASDKELEREKAVLEKLGYGYFRDNFGLPDLPRKTENQVALVREFLQVSTLTVLKKRDMAVRLRGDIGEDEFALVRANAMVQIAANVALRTDAPKFNRDAFEEAAYYALTQTRNHEGFSLCCTKRFSGREWYSLSFPTFQARKLTVLRRWSAVKFSLWSMTGVSIPIRSGLRCSTRSAISSAAISAFPSIAIAGNARKGRTALRGSPLSIRQLTRRLCRGVPLARRISCRLRMRSTEIRGS